MRGSASSPSACLRVHLRVSPTVYGAAEGGLTWLPAEGEAHQDAGVPLAAISGEDTQIDHFETHAKRNISIVVASAWSPSATFVGVSIHLAVSVARFRMSKEEEVSPRTRSL